MGKRLIGLVFFLALSLACFAAANTLTIRPDGQGNYATWSATGCTAANGYQCVDESTLNTSDYVYASSTNKKESFSFSSTGLASATINSVALHYNAKYYATNKNKMQPMIRISGTDYLGSVLTLTSSYADYSQTYTTSPATGSAWTIGQVDALEAGMTTYSSNGGAYDAQVYAVVDYTLADTCSETDGGNNIYTKGNTSGYLSGSYYSDLDYCADSSNVLEYYCSGTAEQSQQESCGTDAQGYQCYLGNVYLNSTDYFCANGACGANSSFTLYQACGANQYCSSGQCLYNNSCSDTDGGYVPAIFGTASGYYNNNPFSSSDVCTGDNSLTEFYCSGVRAYNYTGTCGYDSCVNIYCDGLDMYQNCTQNFCASGACGFDSSIVFNQTCTTNCTVQGNFSVCI
jgi:hypothetical protein